VQIKLKKKSVKNKALAQADVLELGAVRNKARSLLRKQ